MSRSRRRGASPRSARTSSKAFASTALPLGIGRVLRFMRRLLSGSRARRILDCGQWRKIAGAMQAAWQALARNDFRFAERTAREVLARSPCDPEALYLLGSTLLFEGRFAEARGPLESAAGRVERRGAGFRLGHCCLALGELAAAEQALRDEVRRHPNFADAHNTLGVALVSQAKNEEALAAFRAALALEPAHAEANSNAANLLFTLGRAEQALPYAERAVAAKPQLADAQLNL